MPLSRSLFESSIDRSGPLLRSWLLARAASPEDADEILQRTFECAWRKRESFVGTNPLPWLFAIAGLELKYYRRGRSYETPHAADVLERLLDLQRISTDPEHLHAARERLRGLQHCLYQLDGLNRQIVCLFHGLTPSLANDLPDGAPLPLTEGISETKLLPLSDGEIANHLSEPGTSPWSPARVKMRRHRAYAQLQRCMQAGEQSPEPPTSPPGTVPAHPPQEGELSMSDELENPGHPPTSQLLSWLETPDEPGLSPVALHLETCPQCQKALEAGVALLNTLNAPAQVRDLEELQALAPGSLPEPVRAKLLAIGNDAPVLAFPSPPRRTNTLPVWAWSSLALAASLLLTFVWQAGHKPGLFAPEATPAHNPSGPDLGLRGNPSAQAPVQVWVRAAGETQAHALPLTALSAQSPVPSASLPGWEARLSRTATLQLALRAPERSGPWLASATCTHPVQGPIPLAPDILHWTGQADSATPELLVGRPLNLAALGLPAGDRLSCTLIRGSDALFLSILLLP